MSVTFHSINNDSKGERKRKERFKTKSSYELYLFRSFAVRFSPFLALLVFISPYHFKAKDTRNANKEKDVHWLPVSQETSRATLIVRIQRLLCPFHAFWFSSGSPLLSLLRFKITKQQKLHQLKPARVYWVELKILTMLKNVQEKSTCSKVLVSKNPISHHFSRSVCNVVLIFILVAYFRTWL